MSGLAEFMANDRGGICGVLAALVTAFGATMAVAQSDGWEAFMGRCHDPMANAVAPDVSGLTEGGADVSAENFGETSEAWVSYAVQDDLVFALMGDSPDDHAGCLLIDLTGDVMVTYETFEAWRDAELADGRLRATESMIGDFYNSDTGRVPSLRIGLLGGSDPETGQPFVALSVAENPD